MADDIISALERLFRLSEEPNRTPVTVSQLYANAQNHPAGINGRYATEVLSSGRVERWEVLDAHHTLACRYVEIGEPYLQLVYAVETAPAVKGTQISSGWRVYDVPADIRPTEAFGEVLERYGTGVRCGDREGLFLPLETIEGTNLSLTTVAATEAYSLGGMMKRLPQGYTQLTWAFGIDDAKYLSDVRRSRG